MLRQAAIFRRHAAPGAGGKRGDSEISAKPTTIPGVLVAAASRYPNKIAIENEDGSKLTFTELLAACRKAAAAFLAYGLKPGERIAIWAPNSTEWIVATVGAQMVGGVLVPLNTRLKGREAAYILNRCGARLLFTVRGFLGTDYPALLAGESLPRLERTVLFAGAKAPAESWASFLELGNDISDGAVDRALATIKGGDICDILFTSGTTGRPKGAMCSHDQTVECFRIWTSSVGITDADRYLIVNPFFHSFGYKAGWLGCLITGCTMLPHAVFDAEAVIARIPRDRISVIPGPPTLYQSMLTSEARKTADFSSLRLAVTGAAAVPRILVERMHDELGFDAVLTAYGLTESCGVVSVCSRGDSPERVSQTSGRPMPGVEVRCVDKDGHEVPTGEPGELLVRGFNVMKGYLDDPEATAEAIDKDGWLRTGDIAILDAEGYIRITDRAKDMFIVGGFNCYPAEIEGLLVEHPAVAQVAVVGIPDERMGEVGKAFVVLRPGASATENELIRWARENMANYKVPRFVEFVKELPTTASGKVQRFALKT
ncbi:MAG TPA: FadD3 family acyl-CoA ligase [Alphaproteobacteria bacterium]|nr:FadD3 family acyl-CoA ligase [Alphaproteobacteria bacterium]